MTHKLDPVLDAGLRPEASFMKSQHGEVWGYIDSFKHDQGQSKCVFETDEDGSFLQLTLMNEDIGEDHVCLLYTSPSPRDATLSRMPSSA